MARNKTRDVVRAYLEALDPECRWCFAIDMQRVKGKIIAKHGFPDSTVLHLSCPRCGGEFTHYIEVWEERYLRNLIRKLHPELGENITDEQFQGILDRVFPEYGGTSRG